MSIDSIFPDVSPGEVDATFRDYGASFIDPGMTNIMISFNA